MPLGFLFVQEPQVERITATLTMRMVRRAIRSVPCSKINVLCCILNVLHKKGLNYRLS